MLYSVFLWYPHFRLEFCLCNQNLNTRASNLPSCKEGRHTLCSPFSCWRCRQLETEECNSWGGRTLLLGVAVQVWEPSGEEENLRQVANWQRENILKPLVPFQPASCHNFFHFRFPQVPAIYFSSHKHAVLPFQMQTYLIEEGLCELAPRAWLRWISPRLLQNCCDHQVSQK